MIFKPLRSYATSFLAILLFLSKKQQALLRRRIIDLQKKDKILLLHNIISPYRLPIFEELSKHVDLHVLFCKEKHEKRKWDTTLRDYSFKWEILTGFNLIGLEINYPLPFHLLYRKYDAYIVGENLENIFSVLTVLCMSKLYKKPLIIWSGVISTEYDRAKYNSLPKKVIKLIFQYYRRFLYRNANSFIAYCNMAKAFLMENGVSEGKISVGTQIIPEDQLVNISFHKKDAEFEDKKIILSLGYLDKRKGIDYLINAFIKLKRSDAILIIAGTGEEEDYLRSLSKGHPNIHFVGYVQGQEKSKYYSIADIFVLPTLHDPWGLVVNEAMMFGIPIITTESAGCQDLVKDNGFIVKAGDENSLKNCIALLLDNNSLREEMGNKSKQYIRSFSVDFATETFLSAIQVGKNLNV